MAWYWWVVVGVVGFIGLAIGGLLASIPIRFYRGFISRKQLARLPASGTFFTMVDVRCNARVSAAKVAKLDPWLAKNPRALQGLQTSLRSGAGAPAVVVSTSPPCVACYSDEMDAIVLTQFDDALIGKALELGDRLLGVTTYFWTPGRPAVRPVAPDIFPGPGFTDWYDNFAPFIVDFVSDDVEEIERCKAMIPADRWERCFELGYQRLQSTVPPRDGRPSLCHRPVQARKWLWRLSRSLAEQDVKPVPADGSWGNG